MRHTRSLSGARKPTNTKCEWLEACKRAEQRCKRGRGSRGVSRRTVRSQPLVLHGQGSTAAVRGCAYIPPTSCKGSAKSAASFQGAIVEACRRLCCAPRRCRRAAEPPQPHQTGGRIAQL